MYLENDDRRLGEDKLLQFLSEFSCPLTADVELFLKQQSIEFTKKHQAVTYLVLSLEDAELLGWSAVLFAVISIVVYITALMCSHMSAFRVAANIRKELMRHITALPLGVTEKYGSGKMRRSSM